MPVTETFPPAVQLVTVAEQGSPTCAVKPSASYVLNVRVAVFRIYVEASARFPALYAEAMPAALMSAACVLAGIAFAIAVSLAVEREAMSTPASSSA